MKLWARVAGRLLALIVPIGLGVAVIGWSGTLTSAAAQKETVRQPTPVRVITLAEVDLVPRVTGYGTVVPAHEWRAVARIDGEIVETSPLLANGTMVPAGTELLRVDDADLRLTLAQVDAQISALDVKDETLRASLALSNADLEISRAELARQQDLQTRGVSTQTALEQATRAELAARLKLTEIENQLVLNEAERAVLEAQRASSARSLEFTIIVAPFDLLIGTVQADLGQYVTRGATLFSGDGTAAAEVAAQFPMAQMGPLIRSVPSGQSVTDLSATVRLRRADITVAWPATVDRVSETLDVRTQSANIIVRVDQPITQAIAGERPPLRRDMFVEVELSAPAQKALVAPASAITEGRALVVDGEDKLVARTVQTAFTVDGLTVIAGGLVTGDRLVVTDPAVAVPGMNVKPVEDKALAASLARQAAGNGDQP